MPRRREKLTVVSYNYKTDTDSQQTGSIMIDIPPIILNFVYVMLGGILTLFFMKISCTMFNKMVNFNISDELGKGNIAVGLMVMGIFIGLGISLGLVIGLGLS